ncbi:MAG: hypothetical protein M1812_000167 [Candelaria pacifica]|nr:MAG: hypothetical protein M1812_000167 [Candelaria pacifica]
MISLDDLPFDTASAAGPFHPASVRATSSEICCWYQSADVVSHHERPRPGRRRSTVAVARPYTKAWTLISILLLFLCCVDAKSVGVDDGIEATLVSLDIPEEILVNKRYLPPSPHIELRRRQSSPTTVDSAPSPLMTDSNSNNSPLPSPFDTNLGNNFTSSCQGFFQTVLNNSTFKACLPFSLLLQNSQSFFSAAKSIVRITQTLDATCNANFTQCSSTMSSLSQQLVSSSYCGTDYKNQNPIVLQAYNGFVSYEPLYQAGCRRDSSGGYCFADAITNTSSPSDSYPYYLPLGVSLPGASRPTCSTCLQNTMQSFSSAAANKTQPVSQVYSNAAQQINIGCGPTFVNTTVARMSSTGSIPIINPVVALLAMMLTIYTYII